MPVSKEQLAKIIGGRAREMCSPAMDKVYNAKASNINEGLNPDPSQYDSDADKFDAMFSSAAEQNPTPRDVTYTNESAAASRLPDAIKKSMMNERIDVSALGNSSVLDQMNIPAPQKRQTPRPQPITEMAQPSQPTASSSVDYSIIKAIVNECLNQYFEKKPINESASIKGIQLSEGKITILDNKGNIYGAKLEYKGNKNDKKN